jgi:hypothetical protein
MSLASMATVVPSSGDLFVQGGGHAVKAGVQ